MEFPKKYQLIELLPGERSAELPCPADEHRPRCDGAPVSGREDAGERGIPGAAARDAAALNGEADRGGRIRGRHVCGDGSATVSAVGRVAGGAGSGGRGGEGVREGRLLEAAGGRIARTAAAGESAGGSGDASGTWGVYQAVPASGCAGAGTRSPAYSAGAGGGSVAGLGYGRVCEAVLRSDRCAVVRRLRPTQGHWAERASLRRCFRGGVAPPAAEPVLPAVPAAAPVRPTPAQTAEAGEFTKLFQSPVAPAAAEPSLPAVPAASAAPVRPTATPAPTAEAGEFTKHVPESCSSAGAEPVASPASSGRECGACPVSSPRSRRKRANSRSYSRVLLLPRRRSQACRLLPR